MELISWVAIGCLCIRNICRRYIIRKVVLVILVAVGTDAPRRIKCMRVRGFFALFRGILDDARCMGKAGIISAASTVANDGLSFFIRPLLETNPTYGAAVDIHWDN